MKLIERVKIANQGGLKNGRRTLKISGRNGMQEKSRVSSAIKYDCFKLDGSGNCRIKLQLHDAICRLRFYSNSLTHILSLSNSHNNVASIQKNRGDKSHRVIVALSYNYAMRFIGYDSIETR